MKKIALLLVGMLLALILIAASQDDVLKEVYVLFDQKRFAEALEKVDQAMAKTGETFTLLQAKYYLHLELKQYSQALAAALKAEKKEEKKSPWTCADLATIYVRLKEKQKALDWLAEAIKRGFNDYAMLEKDYPELANEPRLAELISQIKAGIGIGKPTKDFAVKLLNGDAYAISSQKGKVVLVDFWATWCRPCREEIPSLKQFFTKYSGEGFTIIGISLDNERQKLEKFIATEKLGWAISFSGKGWDDDTAALYGVKSIPSFWLVDRQGVLRHFGLRGEQLGIAIAELLAEK